MIRHKNIISILLLITIQNIFTLPSAVTYTFSGGRFGDNLLAYCHAKWISYHYKIPLLYKPFEYSDQLMMHILEIPYSAQLQEQFEKVVEYTAETEVDPDSNYLYNIPYFSESIFNRNDAVFPFLFFVDWKDDQFKSLLKQYICPIKKLSSVDLVQDGITVALHVRKGTGWDIPVYQITPDALTASHPLRFAPDSFYILQLKKIARIYHDKKMYVHVFTDHNNPFELIESYKKAVNCDHMIFSCRMAQNNEFINVLEDFFSIAQFDCLIRADSNFSILASKLGDYKILMVPWHGILMGTITMIDETYLEINGQPFIIKEVL